MNMYRILGDRIGTLEARALAQDLIRWHDAMVKHLRVAKQRDRGCWDGCPHDEARALWSSALDTFGEHASELQFLCMHGAAPAERANAPAGQARV